MNDNQALSVLPMSWQGGGPALPVMTDFQTYARMVQQWPLLTEEEERHYFTLWKIEHQQQALRPLVLSHLKLVVRVVKDHRAYGLMEEDLAQEGVIGLMKAIQKFDIDMGVRLSSYAIKWIEAEIREYIFKNWRMVRLSTSASMKKLFFNYRQTVMDLEDWGANRVKTVTETELRQALGVEQHQLEHARHYFLGFDQGTVGSQEDTLEEKRGQQVWREAEQRSEGLTPLEWSIEQEQYSKETDIIEKGLSTLNDREKAIIRRRWLKEQPAPLHLLAQEHAVSMERVRQIEAHALGKMKKKLVLGH